MQISVNEGAVKFLVKNIYMEQIISKYKTSRYFVLFMYQPLTCFLSHGIV